MSRQAGSWGGVDLAQRVDQIAFERLKVAEGGDTGAADQNVVPAGLCAGQKGLGHDGAQAAFGAVAGDGVADLLRAGEADLATMGIK